MKLLTQKDTDKIFFDVTKLGAIGMDSQLFNEAVNRILYDRQLTRLILKRVRRILDKMYKNEAV